MPGPALALSDPEAVLEKQGATSAKQLLHPKYRPNAGQKIDKRTSVPSRHNHRSQRIDFEFVQHGRDLPSILTNLPLDWPKIWDARYI